MLAWGCCLEERELDRQVLASRCSVLALDQQELESCLAKEPGQQTRVGYSGLGLGQLGLESCLVLELDQQEQEGCLAMGLGQQERESCLGKGWVGTGGCSRGSYLVVEGCSVVGCSVVGCSEVGC